MNVLFICSRNKWRSRTAETIFKKERKINVKSAGTSKAARVRVSATLIDWAEVIFVMESKHKSQITENFRAHLDAKEIIVLSIPDEYQYMDEDLIEHLQDAVQYHLDL